MLDETLVAVMGSWCTPRSMLPQVGIIGPMCLVALAGGGRGWAGDRVEITRGISAGSCRYPVGPGLDDLHCRDRPGVRTSHRDGRG